MPKSNKEYYINRQKLHELCFYAWPVFSPETRLRVLRSNHILLDHKGDEAFADEVKYWVSFVDVVRVTLGSDFERLVLGVIQELMSNLSMMVSDSKFNIRDMSLSELNGILERFFSGAEKNRILNFSSEWEARMKKRE